MICTKSCCCWQLWLLCARKRLALPQAWTASHVSPPWRSRRTTQQRQSFLRRHTLCFSMFWAVNAVIYTIPLLSQWDQRQTLQVLPQHGCGPSYTRISAVYHQPAQKYDTNIEQPHGNRFMKQQTWIRMVEAYIMNAIRVRRPTAQ